MSIATEIAKSQSEGFRRAYIRRRSNTTGLYETDWYEITDFVKKWGSIERAIDDVRLFNFTHSGANLVVRNDTGAFNVEDNVSSLWNGYMTRYRTLLKIEAGYIDSNDVELPTNPTLFIGILADEIPISAVKNDATLRARSLITVFDEVQASDIAGLGPTQSASDLVTKIRDHTDGSGNFYFQQFISSGAWTIQTTTNQFNIATSTALGSMTAWEFMVKLAEAEGYLLFINRTGGLEFRDRSERTTTAAFDFLGLGFPKMNIVQLQEYKEATNKLYTFFRMRYLDADTSTSYVTAGSVSTVDPSSTSWKYGSRKYEFSNDFMANTAAAQNVVNALNVAFAPLRDEVQIKTVFVPQLEISDKVTLSYRSFDIADATLWGQFVHNVNLWADESGENFDWSAVGFKILSINIDLDEFFCAFALREI